MGNGRDISKDKLGRSLLGDAVASGLVAASPYGAGTASAWCASAGGIINLGKKESTILKELVVGAMAAGVLAVPLAGVAGADPSEDNPGVPGNFGEFVGAPAGIPPGQIIKQRAQLPGSVKDVAIAEGFANPGDAVNNFAPGHNK